MNKRQKEIRDSLKKKRVVISEEVFRAILCAVKRPYKTNMPEDATFLRYYYDVHTDLWSVMVHSASFEPIKEGSIIPEFTLVIEDL